MTAPHAYAGETITVDPNVIYGEMWLAVKVDAPLIGESINRIADVWNNLKLGWVGKTSDEAEAFAKEWKDAISALFGDGHTPGVFGKIAAAVLGAGWNYATTETVVKKMLSDFSTGLQNPASGGDTSRHVVEGPIFENT